MSDTPMPVPPPQPGRGELTAAGGTPVAVDITRDLQVRSTWLVLLAGPVIWGLHFTVVHLVAEAGSTGSGPGLRRFDPPVPTVVTIVATAVAVAACLGVAGWAFLRSRRGVPAGQAAAEPAAQQRHRDLARIGLLLALLSAIAIVFVATPALVLPSC